MGISIHYSGRLKAADILSQLISEVKDIAIIHKWKYTVFKEAFPDGKFSEKVTDDEAYGICFSPPECEPICMTFASNGRLVSPWMLEYSLKHKEEIFFGNFTKTHYAGADMHKIIILLTDHLSKKYFESFELIDEAEYWETRDEKLMHHNFDKLNGYMDGFAKALDTQSMRDGETLETYLIRLAQDVKDATHQPSDDSPPGE